MNYREIIRKLLEEQFVEEAAKERFIEANQILLGTEKQYLIEIFKEKPYLEREIDWNLAHKMKFDDFMIKLKSGMVDGLERIKLKKDYVTLKNVDCDDPKFIGAYVPLTNKGASWLRDSSVGGSNAPWCIGHDNYDSYWDKYRMGMGSAEHLADSKSVFIILVFLFEKFAIQVSEKYGIIVWPEENKPDKHTKIIRDFDILRELRKADKLFDDVREEICIDPPKDTIGGFAGVPFTENSDGTVDVHGTVEIDNDMWDDESMDYEKLKVKYHRIDGDLILYDLNLEKVYLNEIEFVGGDVSLNNNNLEFDELYLPKVIKGDVYLKNNGRNFFFVSLIKIK